MPKDKPKMTKAEAGQIGGSATSPAKSAASRENGKLSKLGGRPPKADADPKRRARYRKNLLRVEDLDFHFHGSGEILSRIKDREQLQDDRATRRVEPSHRDVIQI